MADRCGNSGNSVRLYFGGLLPYTHTHTHTHKSKWLKDLNLRHDTIKLLEENISKTFSNVNHTYVFLGQSPKAIEILKKERSNQTHKLLHFIGNHKENEKTTYRMGENICK